MYTMYRCCDCYEVFDEPTMIQDIVTTDPYPMGPMIGTCPYCGSDDYEEVQECPDCNEYHLMDEMVYVELEDGTSIEVCPDCYEANYFIPPNVEEE